MEFQYVAVYQRYTLVQRLRRNQSVLPFLCYNDNGIISLYLCQYPKMNIVKSRTSGNLPKKEGAVSAGSQPISLYQEIPNMEVSLDDFEEFALDRLKVRIP